MTLSISPDQGPRATFTPPDSLSDAGDSGVADEAPTHVLLPLKLAVARLTLFK
jgi:hypothetical protein